MTDNGHPTYPNPIVQEAICQVLFRRKGSAWSPLVFSEFLERVKEEFPSIEAVPVQVFTLQFGPSGLQGAAPDTPNRQALRYRHRSRPLLIQLSEEGVVLNAVGKYPGWATLRTDIAYVWERVVETIDPESIVRIGLRYINRIERGALDETPGTWLVSNDYIPEAVLRSQPGFLSQIQTKPEPTEIANVILAHTEASNSNGALLLDIDRATTREIAPELSLLLAEADRLHDDIWKVFSSAKGRRLEMLLAGELA